MTRLIALIALAAVTLACPWASSQATLADWSFDNDVGTWASIDPAGTLAVTGDANVIREADNAVAEYSYSAEVGTMAGVMTPIDTTLADAKTLSFWIRTTEGTITLISINEADGSSYMSGFYSLPDRWQEVSLSLTEFKLDEDDSADENGQLDPGQIGGIAIIDATPFLVEMAAQVTFIDPPTLGPRIIRIDDVRIGDQALPPRWETIDVDGARGIRFDSFEATPLQWLSLAGDTVVLDYDDEIASDGAFSLRISYDLPPGKIFGILTDPSAAPLAGTTRLQVSLLSENKTTLIIGLKERDGSEYNVLVPLEPGQDFTVKEFAFTAFAVDDDGLDENGKLDIDQVNEFSINEVSIMTGEPVGINTLWIDDITFIE